MKSPLNTFFDSCDSREYPKGQILLYQAEETNSVFFIRKGFVKVYDITAAGEEKLLLVLGPGDMYPTVWTFRASESLLYFYEAMSDVEVTVCQRKKFLSEIDESHEFTKDLLRYFVERIKDLSLRVECLEASNAKLKVAQVLEYLLKRHPGKKDKTYRLLALQTTHQTIASMAGISRETASMLIKQFEDEGILTQANAELGIHEEKLEKFLEA